MIVLSLFDGMSCGRIALERAGVPVTKYYASEIDKYATIVSEANYPDIIRLGDINDWRNWDIDWASIDLILAGSPCQGFSFAGKQLAFDDPRSALFFTFVDVLNEVNGRRKDVKFLLENVKMARVHLETITSYLFVQPQRINSDFYSAGMRDRYYWFNWTHEARTIGVDVCFDDILESGHARAEKAFALTATYHKKGAEATRQRAWRKSQRPIAWLNDNETRWLTVTECERLMTVPEGYTAHVSNTQRYKMLGNGWTVDVIAHILESMPHD